MSERPQVWTVLALLEWTARHLAEKGFDEARLHVELLLAHVLDLTRLDLYLQFDRPLTPEELSRFRLLYERRLRHEPLQYILGTTEFMGLKVDVAPGVLIPRPETELLVECALDHLRRSGNGHPLILDVGCGSGNVSLALAKAVPGATVLAVDNAEAALDLTQRNADHLGVGNIRTLRLDVLHDGCPDTGFDLIVSNPPYIPAHDLSSLQPEVREFEPATALTDGEDGLSFYRRFAAILPSVMSPGAALLVEVGFGQAPAVKELFLTAGFAGVNGNFDFAGIERVVTALRGRETSDTRGGES
jgi:release factor glutamine methyltransferase